MEKRTNHWHLFVIIMLAIALSSCHASQNWASGGDDSIYPELRKSKKNKKDKKQKEKQVFRVDNQGYDDVPSGKGADVIKAARKWAGVPYQYGGNSRNGVDCSGLVCMAYSTGAGIDLPRSSSEQAEFCKRISRDAVRPGDLVFFVSSRGGSRINHVAIYLGNNRIIHATTSRGVIESSLDDPYWKTHYHCCGRVL